MSCWSWVGRYPAGVGSFAEMDKLSCMSVSVLKDQTMLRHGSLTTPYVGTLPVAG